MPDAEVIDAHQHFWELRQPFDYEWLETPGLEPIRRDFLPADLSDRIRDVGVDRTIFVQTQHNLDENRWVLGLADQDDFIAGVVGWVDLASGECESQLLEFKAHPKFVGIRHVTQDEPDDDFIIREDVVRGLRVLEKHNVPFDLLFYVKHLKHAARLALSLPNLPMVIDHLAKPDIADGKMDGWRENLQTAARHENVYCKLSGLVTEADWNEWKPADLRPYVETALDAFGPARCMFGSDWPVCELAASYRQVHDALREILGQLGASEIEQIFGGTARRFYQLNSD